MGGLTFLEETHQYFMDGVELPSVTRITRFLSYDIAEFAKPWLRDEAAVRGTAIHAASEAMDYGLELDAIPAQYLPYLDAYAAFLRDYCIRGWEGIEVQMGSAVLGFAGTADRIGQINRRTAIVDIKSSYALHIPSLTAQLTGYGMMWEEEHPGPVPDLYGLHLRGNGTYTLRAVPYAPSLFNPCLTLHQALLPKKGAHK
ncbi:conserved hypothetical protein [uncultured Eubacteriales bacterium]|uniref:PD-(D/E)XK endonuclease-like domain-containing protein n=1 Tax=uncultured Eubacteriales bacterium TaxID=172733 RepID=A0A212JSY0_9FIRM|nr:conserved hypothetical protein [uncultured Eubacteriales bacterium]